jgi:hypothetical protein
MKREKLKVCTKTQQPYPKGFQKTQWSIMIVLAARHCTSFQDQKAHVVVSIFNNT